MSSSRQPSAESRGQDVLRADWSTALLRQAHWVFLAAVMALFANAVLVSPNEFGDQFIEVVATYERTLLSRLESHLSDTNAYFRPLEMVWREAVFWTFGDDLFAFNLALMAQLIGLGGLLAYAFRVRCPRDAVAATFGLACLFGYHGLHASLELNLVISNLMVFLGIAVAIVILTSRPSPRLGVFAVVVSLIAILTKEIGLVIPVIFLVAHLAGFAVPGRKAAIAIGLLLVLYLVFRLTIVFGFGEIHDPVHGREARDLGSFALNAFASLISIVSAWPRSADFASALGGIDLPPWRIFQILMPLLAFSVIAWANIRGRSWARYGNADLRRWAVILAVVVATSSGLGFFYPVDRQSAIVAPILAYNLFLSVKWLLATTRFDAAPARGHRGLVLILLALSVCSTMRVFGGFYILLGQAQRNQDNWVADIARYEALQQGEAAYRLPYLEQFRSAALGMPRRTPWIDGSIEKELFGSSHSVAR